MKTSHSLPKISFLLGSPDISGGTYVIFKHAIGLKKQGFDITIITEEIFDKKRLFWFPKAQDLRFIDLNTANKENYDLCIATWWKTVFYLSKIKAKKIAYFVQSIESKFCRPEDGDLKSLIDFTYRLPLIFITEASWIQKYLKDNFNKNSHLVLNGIDKNIFNNSDYAIDKTRPYGIRILVEGALNVFFKQTELTISLCKKAGIEDVWLLTPTKINSFPGVSRLFSQVPFQDVGKIMRSCDLIVKLSKVEGMFGPPLEMMHCGGTAITFDVTGYDEYIKDGINALVLKMDDEAGVVKCLYELSQDKHYLDILKKNSLLTAREWPTWEKSNSKMTKIIHKILDSNQEKNINVCEIVETMLQLSGPIHASINYPYTVKDIIKLFYLKIKNNIRKHTSTRPLVHNYTYKKLKPNNLFQ